MAVCVAASVPAAGQVLENPEDPFGIAIPHRRVRLVHSGDATRAGTTAHLRAHDPFLFYQLGRDLVNRQFELEHGILGRPGERDVPLYVAVPRTRPGAGTAEAVRFARDHAASCGLCHSSVYREPGAGPTIASTSGLGRNSTHFFGGGLVEMIGQQVGRTILNLYDTNRNGWIDGAEVRGPSPVRIHPVADSAAVDFGDLSPGPDGVPRLNSVFRIWYVSADGSLLPDALSLEDEGVAGFGFAMQPFGWGRGRVEVDGRQVPQGGEASTLREFYSIAADFHMGLEAHDPVQQGADPASRGFGGLAGMSLNGARQFDFGGSVDPGRRKTQTGLSLDDPDGDGHFHEVTQGDLDAIEFFLLHTPAPAVRTTPEGELGRRVLQRIGCTRCHVENWQLEAQDEARGYTGDRRLFRFDTESRTYEDGASEILGRLVLQSVRTPGGGFKPRREGFLVEGVYSDFKHWDVGEAFYERRFDGSLQRLHRTAPLWGAGSSAPYGHAGNFLTLHDVISAHGGAAARERQAYVELEPAQRAHLLTYLANLVLYSSDEIPADIDGDGIIANQFDVDGQAVGYERFDARFLFNVKPRYRQVGTVVNPDGRMVPVGIITNVDEAYGLLAATRRDTDEDGFPDAMDPLPNQPGIVAPGGGGPSRP